jgi:N-acetylmuramoyl-L-alanine amidase
MATKLRLLVAVLLGVATSLLGGSSPLWFAAVGNAPTPAPGIAGERHDASLRDIIVAIDAGHGGKDPGAIGPNGTMEKDVVLSIARRLAKLVDKEPGMRAVMIRDSDVYIPSRERIAVAQQHRADLFISIHADAASSPEVHGSSVYVPSGSGASSEAARRLAERENPADLVGGMNLNGKDETLARVLMDRSQPASGEASLKLAINLIDGLQMVSEPHTVGVDKATFGVLRSPDVPSVLVETGYISSPVDEQRLGNSTYQQALALAMLEGMRKHFNADPLPDTLLATFRRERHVVRAGETLSEIAARYRISVDELRSSNGLDSDILQVGQVLLIPTSDI